MIDKINISQVSELLMGSTGAKQQSINQAQSTGKDASLQADYEELIKKAAATQDNANIDLQKIKELLKNDQIDTPENIKLTAKNIADLGI